jgi:hypothetical protein
VGLARIAATTGRMRDQPVEAICDHLIAELGGARRRNDDVVVLCLRLDD